MRLLLIIIYTLLYLSHIYYGPYFYRFIMKKEKIKYKSKNLKEMLNKSVFITYVSLLYTIYFFFKLDTESYINALIMTILSLILYIIKYKGSVHYYESIIDHSILIVPFIFYKYYFNIPFNLFKPGRQSFFTIILLLMYSHYHNKIYD